MLLKACSSTGPVPLLRHQTPTKYLSNWKTADHPAAREKNSPRCSQWVPLLEHIESSRKNHCCDISEDVEEKRWQLWLLTNCAAAVKIALAVKANLVRRIERKVMLQDLAI